MSNVPGSSVFWNCRTPTEKVSEFLDHHWQPHIKQGNSSIKDTNNFSEKLRATGEIPKGSILVTAAVVGLYPSILHVEDLNILQKQKRLYRIIKSNDWVSS